MILMQEISAIVVPIGLIFWAGNVDTLASSFVLLVIAVAFFLIVFPSQKEKGTIR
ncbi:MAG: hypothetical protein SVM79_05765 [Chloroflexota bacterium]|nr:hypothetical protein [Chloroflexota bacterium]